MIWTLAWTIKFLLKTWIHIRILLWLVNVRSHKSDSRLSWFLFKFWILTKIILWLGNMRKCNFGLKLNYWVSNYLLNQWINIEKFFWFGQFLSETEENIQKTIYLYTYEILHEFQPAGILFMVEWLFFFPWA